MSANLPFERQLASWMADEAATGVPAGAIDEALSVTGRLRPRPQWLALLRESPMQTQSRVLVGSPTRRLALAGVLALLLVVVALVVGATLLTKASSDDWPMLRGGADRHAAAQSGPVGYGVVRWRLHAAAAFSKGAVVAGDVAYAASDDGIVHAVSIGDGRELWSHQMTGGAADVAVADGRVFVGSGSGAIVALDAASGVERWKTPSYISPSAIAIAEGRLFFGTGDGLLLSLDAGTGAERWRVRVPGATGGVHNPAVAGGRVFASADLGIVAAVDAGTGATIWNTDIGDDSVATAVVSDGILYIGVSGDATSGHLRAFSASNGQQLWQVDQAFIAPAISNGIAYATVQPQGVVAALNARTGQEQWRTTLPTSTRHTAIAGSTIFVPGDSGHALYALNASKGEYLWSVPVDGGNPCCIAVARGLVIVGTTGGSLYAIAGDGQAVQPAPVPTAAASSAPEETPGANPSGAPQPSASIAPLADVRWSVNGPDAEWGPTTLALDASGHIWASDPNNHRFTIFDQDGTFLESWGKRGTGDGEFNLQRSNGNGYGTVAFAPDGSFFVLDVGNHRVQAFDAKRKYLTSWGEFGSRPGQFSDPVGIAVARDGTVYVLDDERAVIEHYDRTGNVLGSFDPFPNGERGLNTANSLAIDADGNLYVSMVDPGAVEKLAPSGKLLKTFGAPGSGAGTILGQANWMAIDAKGRLYVSGGTVTVYDPDGTFVGEFGHVPGAPQLAIPGGLLLLDGDLILADVGDFDFPNGRGTLMRLHLLPPLGP